MTDDPHSQTRLQARFAARLAAELDDLRSLSRRSRNDRDPVALDQQSVGRVSRVDSLQVQAMSQATEGRRLKRIQQIEGAQARIAEGTYGHCTRCGEPIDLKRLDVDPAAFRCVDCAV